MQPDKIGKMLIRYYDGQTTQEEERELKKIAENEFLAQISVPQGLESRLSKMIDNLDKRERRITRIKHTLAIAASIAVIATIGVLMQKPRQHHDTCKSPQEAYAQAEKALITLSEALNKGTDRLEEIEQTTEKINKQLEQLNF